MSPRTKKNVKKIPIPKDPEKAKELMNEKSDKKRQLMMQYKWNSEKGEYEFKNCYIEEEL